jgi:TonB family protein
VPVKQVSPDYPLIAREARAEGNVVVAVRIDAQGKVLWARVVSSSAVPALEEAARRAALGWLFRPARQRDQAVPATLHIPFRFRLGN